MCIARIGRFGKKGTGKPYTSFAQSAKSAFGAPQKPFEQMLLLHRANKLVQIFFIIAQLYRIFQR